MQTAGKMDALSFEGFLAFMQEAEVKHEFLNGQVFAMAGASLDHCTVVTNLLVAIHGGLSGTPCRVFAADALVRIQTATDDIGYYPDLVVTCNKEEHSRYVTSPKLIVEVLSPSTRSFDLTYKFSGYKQLQSLREYVVVDIEHRSVLVYQLISEDHWLTRIVSSGSVDFDSLDIQIPVESIFANIGQQQP